MDRSPRLLLTRPEAASHRFLAACEATTGKPISAVVSPVMAIRSMPVALDGVPAALILTSEHGAVRAGELGLSPKDAWCVGPHTAEVAQGWGFRVIEAGPNAEALLMALLEKRPPGLLLHLRGEHARGDLVGRLRRAGLVAAEAVAYRQEALDPSPGARAALAGPAPLVVPLFSPRSAFLLSGWSPSAPLHVVAMSGAIAAAAEGLHPRTLQVASDPTRDGMVAATLGRLDDLANGAP